MDFKIALVHDALINKGGAERVFQVFCEIFPNAPIYTSVYFPNRTLPYFKQRKIHTTPLQKIVKNENQFKNLFPLSNYYMQKMNISGFDIIVSSSTFCGKYINKKKAKHFCYMHQPFRLLWEPESYSANLSNIKKSMIQPFLPYLRNWDLHSVNNIDLIITNCITTKKKIKNYYNKDSIVIHPPVFNNIIEKKTNSSDYFLIVSRLEQYKNIDIAIVAFNKLKQPLKIVGDGSLSKSLKKLAKKNIQFYHNVNDNQLFELYRNCIALIFPQEEDFGLVSLEANSFGKPVICYGYGGVETTMVKYDGHNLKKATALFYNEQSTESLINAIKKFESLSFDPHVLRKNAERFSVVNFKKKIIDIIKNH